MLKTFKQFMTEVHVDAAISSISQNNKLSDGSIKKNYDIHHTSKMGDYDISHGTHKKNKTQAATFIHHNGEHVGTIYGNKHADGKEGFVVKKSSLSKAHRGQNLMSKTYAHLATKHNHEIHSDTVQSYGGHNIWKNLHKMSGVKVTARKADNKTVEPSFHDIGKDHTIRNPKVIKIHHYELKKSK